MAQPEYQGMAELLVNPDVVTEAIKFLAKCVLSLCGVIVFMGTVAAGLAKYIDGERMKTIGQIATDVKNIAQLMNTSALLAENRMTRLEEKTDNMEEAINDLRSMVGDQRSRGIRDSRILS